MANKKTPTGKERTVMQSMIDMCTRNEDAYYIVWKYAPEALPCPYELKTYEDLQKYYSYFEGRTQESMEKALCKDSSQAAIKYLHKRLDTQRDVALLNKYYDLAMAGDVQALKAYMSFKKQFFADEEASELMRILKGVDIEALSNDEDIEDFQMDL